MEPPQQVAAAASENDAEVRVGKHLSDADGTAEASDAHTTAKSDSDDPYDHASLVLSPGDVIQFYWGVCMWCWVKYSGFQRYLT